MVAPHLEMGKKERQRAKRVKKDEAKRVKRRGGERAPAAGDGQQLDPDVFNQKLVRRLEGVPREKRLHMLDMLSKMEADLSEAPSPSAAPKN